MTKREIEIKSADDKPEKKGGNGQEMETEEKVEIKDSGQTQEEKEEVDAGTAPEDQDMDSSEKEEEKPEPTPEEKIVELTNQLLRMAAEFENYKKKNAREYDRGALSGSINIVQRLIPVLDSFDSALGSQNDVPDQAKGIYEGLVKIQSQMVENLFSAGLKVIEPEKGTPLDPNFHEVLMVQETDEVPGDTIFAIFQKGYSFKGQLVRAAKVQVAKEPPTEN